MRENKFVDQESVSFIQKVKSLIPLAWAKFIKCGPIPLIAVPSFFVTLKKEQKKKNTGSSILLGA